MEKDSRVYIAGHRGMVGSAIHRELVSRGFTRLIGRTSGELNLTNQEAVEDFYLDERPEYVFVAAAKVGGILANDTYPADFLLRNLEIQNNLIDGARRHGVKKLLFLGSSCIYPKHAPQPIPEDALLTGPLEPTNEWYAIAKIAGIKLCQAIRKQHDRDFISAMPTNLYGPNDNYHPQNSHVLPALIRRFHEAKEAGVSSVTCWGTGSPFREFLHADDLAKACVFLMENYSSPEIVNIGSGSDLTIRELSEMVSDVIGYPGEINWDTSKPDGTPRKLMDSSRLFAMGWKPEIGLREGIAGAYQDFLSRAAA